MPKVVTVRFFQIGKLHPAGMSLRNALDQIAAFGQPGNRERQLGPGYRCRLERYVSTAGYLTGEVTRVRSEDFPAEIHPHGTAQLNVAVPIGEGIAFRYREADHVLAIQFDNRIVSPGRFIDYVMQAVPASQFTINAKADNDALRNFRARPLKKVKIKLAQPQDLRNVEPAMESAARSFRSLGRDYDAPIITLEMSVGHEDASLSRDAKRMVEGFVRRAAGQDEDVKSVRIRPDNGPGIENREVDLLDALLSAKEEIPSPNDPDANYDARRRLVERTLNAHR